MPKPFSLTIKRDGRDDLVVAGEFTDEENAILLRFLEHYDRLAESRPFREGVPLSIKIEVKEGETVSSGQLPDNDTLDILLQRLRPFILQTQYASFVTVVAILKRRIGDVQVRQMLREQSQIYDGRNARQLMTLRTSDGVVNSEKVLYDWLNSHEWHADPEKRQAIDRLFERLPTPVMRGILVGMLLDKFDAVCHVAAFVALLFGRIESLEVNSRDVRPESSS